MIVNHPDDLNQPKGVRQILEINTPQEAFAVYLEAMEKIKQFNTEGKLDRLFDEEMLSRGSFDSYYGSETISIVSGTIGNLIDASDGWFKVETLLMSQNGAVVAQATVNGFQSSRCQHENGQIARLAALAQAYAKSLAPQRPILEAFESIRGIYNSSEAKAHRAAMGLDDDLNDLEPELDWRLFATRARLCDKAYLAKIEFHQKEFNTSADRQIFADTHNALADFDQQHPEVLKAIGKS